MKKFMFLFLVVAFVAVMAGGAMAETCSCNEQLTDTLFVDLSILPCNRIDIQDSSIALCTYIPCEGVCADEANFTYDFCATGNDSSRKLEVTIDKGSYPGDPNVDLKLRMPSNTGGMMLNWNSVNEFTPLPGNATGQTGLLTLIVHPGATEIICNEPIELDFEITSTWCCVCN